MAQMTGKIEIAYSATGRDEESLRRFHEKLADELARSAEYAATMFSGVTSMSASGEPTALTVRK